MNNKEIIRAYEQICTTLKAKKSEENKQQFLILFKELDIQLTRSFNSRLEELSYTASTLRVEIKRLDSVLALIKYRCDFRERMLNDHKKYIGYDAINLDAIDELSNVEDYKAYKNNLTIASKIVGELLKCNKRLKSLKAQLQRNPRNKEYLEKEISLVQAKNTEAIEELKGNSEVLEDLYNYCLTAPFNEENAYIEYILIKLNPKSELKINLNKENKRNVRKKSEAKKTVLEMPSVTQMGSVKPNNILKNTIDSVNDTDLDIPTNGMVSNNEVKIKISDII